MTLTLYQFRPIFDLPNASPFCMKLETYLRMAGLPYEVATVLKPRSSTGKAPYIVIDGKTLTDSGLIIQQLEQANGHPVDGRLTLTQRAESLAFQRLMDEHLYWAFIYMRWVDPAAPAALRADLQQRLGVPRFLSPITARVATRRHGKALYRQGLGRNTPDVIWHMGIADIQALAHWLGTRPFGFGENPTTVDACLAAYIGNILRTPWDNPLKTAAAKHRTLVDHFTRMQARYFPERAA